MMRKSILISCALLSCYGSVAIAQAQTQNEQFIPVLSYRTGPYGSMGSSWANGVIDYYTLINERDKGINGVKIAFEECETGFATDKGVECYERLKNKGPTGAAFINPLSTGITYALTEKTATDKIPIITMGYGRADSKNGAVFAYNFPALGTYWSGASLAVQYFAKEAGGFDKLRSKKIALLYHDSPFGKEPIPMMQLMAEKYGFEFSSLPVTHPGLEQKSQWLIIRRNKPDFVLLWGWGPMNAVAIKEAAAVAFPRNKMLGIWWSGAEDDVVPAGDLAVGYRSLVLQSSSGKFSVHADIEKYVYAQGKASSGSQDKMGGVLYNRGVLNAMFGIEAIRTAQKKYGKRPLTGEEIRWGLENLEISEARIKELGFEGMMKPIKLSCSDHEGVRSSRVQEWDGKNWKIVSDWFTADQALIEPMVQKVSQQYAAERKIQPRDCAAVN